MRVLVQKKPPVHGSAKNLIAVNLTPIKLIAIKLKVLYLLSQRSRRKEKPSGQEPDIYRQRQTLPDRSGDGDVVEEVI